MSNFKISAAAVPIVRSALLTELAYPAAAIGEASLLASREQHTESFQLALQELDRYDSALDAVGWSAQKNPGPVAVELEIHGQALRAALQSQLAVERDYIQVELSLTGARAQRARAARNIRQIEKLLDSIERTITQPTDALTPAANYRRAIERGRTLIARYATQSSEHGAHQEEHTAVAGDLISDLLSYLANLAPASVPAGYPTDRVARIACIAARGVWNALAELVHEGEEPAPADIQVAIDAFAAYLLRA